VDALELFRRNPGDFDLVVTDMTMPQMTGDRFARELMEIRRDIPVIMCTGHSDHISVYKAEKMGIREFLMKPIEMEELSITIRRVLSLGR
jgi:DNA-binding NtrC family response regulator